MYTHLNAITQLEKLDGSANNEAIAKARFLIATMCTQSHAQYAARLLASCAPFELAALAYQVPTIHNSISSNGSSNETYTKANFIYTLLEKFNKPILFLDSDCVVRKPIPKIFEYVKEKIDFAAFNWLATEHNETYVPLRLIVDDSVPKDTIPNNFYIFANDINFRDASQLITSGAVQLYNNSESAMIFLNEWQKTIVNNPLCADDHCLDFAYNHFGRNLHNFKTTWLEMEYARYGHWIYCDPIIDHPDIPSAGLQFRDLDKSAKKSRFNTNLFHPKATEPIFPRDCIVDVLNKVLLYPQGPTAQPIAVPLKQDIWVTQ